jgi:hypothetical protein
VAWVNTERDHLFVWVVERRLNKERDPISTIALGVAIGIQSIHKDKMVKIKSAECAEHQSTFRKAD